MLFQSTTPAAKTELVSRWGDLAGMVASIACAIHCAAMPFVITLLPSLGLGFLADETFHRWMALVCFILAFAAFVPGFRKHRRLVPVSMGVLGLSLIFGAAFGLEGECCPSCALAAMDQPVVETSLVADTSVETCEDACCPDCGDAAVLTESTVGSDVELVTVATMDQQPCESSTGLETSVDTCDEACCPACSEDAAMAKLAVGGSVVDSVASDSATVAVMDDSPASSPAATASFDACDDACCPACISEVADGEIPVVQAGIFNSDVFLSRIAPWLTPLGGLILVSAHLLNRRFGCLCGCCETTASAEA